MGFGCVYRYKSAAAGKHDPDETGRHQAWCQMMVLGDPAIIEVWVMPMSDGRVSCYIQTR